MAASAEKAQPTISSTVAVSVPAPEVKVAVAAPPPEAKAAAGPAAANATAPAQAMRTVATPPPAVGSRVAIQSVEADGAGALVARGSAEPNATVRLYLNDADVADAKTQLDGRWSLTIKSGMTQGGYLMRADEINPGGATVVASVNTPFDYPAASGRRCAYCAKRNFWKRRAIARALARRPGYRIGPNQAGRHRAHLVGAQPQLLRRPDALPGDLRGQQMGNP